MTQHFDAIILGGGNAGFGVASVLAQAGRSIAMVEEAEFGGVCPNRGCTPKKVLVAAAHALSGAAGTDDPVSATLDKGECHLVSRGSRSRGRL